MIDSFIHVFIRSFIHSILWFIFIVIHSFTLLHFLSFIYIRSFIFIHSFVPLLVHLYICLHVLLFFDINTQIFSCLCVIVGVAFSRAVPSLSSNLSSLSSTTYQFPTTSPASLLIFSSSTTFPTISTQETLSPSSKFSAKLTVTPSPSSSCKRTSIALYVNFDKINPFYQITRYNT